MKYINYYTAQWCSPCRSLKPIMQELQAEGIRINFLDIDNIDKNLISNAAVRSVPTCILYKSGKEVTRWTGVLSKAEILRRYNLA